jgi:hypothetical protein
MMQKDPASTQSIVDIEKRVLAFFKWGRNGWGRSSFGG